MAARFDSGSIPNPRLERLVIREPYPDPVLHWPPGLQSVEIECCLGDFVASLVCSAPCPVGELGLPVPSGPEAMALSLLAPRVFPEVYQLSIIMGPLNMDLLVQSSQAEPAEDEHEGGGPGHSRAVLEQLLLSFPSLRRLRFLRAVDMLRVELEGMLSGTEGLDWLVGVLRPRLPGVEMLIDLDGLDC